LVRKGERSISGVVKNDATTVGVNDVLVDLFSPSVESKLAIAVTADAERLIGVMPRVTLLAALGPGPNATEEITLPVQPVPTTVIDQVLDASEDGQPLIAPATGYEEVH